MLALVSIICEHPPPLLPGKETENGGERIVTIKLLLDSKKQAQYAHIGRCCANSFNYKHSSHSKTGLYKKVVGNYPYFRRVGGRFVLASGICSFNIQT